MSIKQFKEISLLIAVMASSGCVQPGVKTGGSENLVTGAAGGSTSINANKSLEHCATPLGTLAVSDGRIIGSRGVTTVDPLIRLAVLQSNCFVMTSIGNMASSALISHITDQQRNSGEFRAGSKQHKGQAVAADYLLEPQIIVDNETTSGGSAGIGGALVNIGLGAAGLGGLSALTGAAAGEMQTKTSDVALTLTDIRSTVQISISSGSSSANNLSASGWGGLFGGGGVGGAGMGMYNRTPEGISIAAAFFDAYNGMVQSVRNYKAQEVKGGMGQGGQLKVK